MRCWYWENERPLSKNMALRIRLAGAVKAVMDRIEIDRDGHATVSVMGGKRVYRFA
ncbi:hypothetical protein D3C72_344980 [compost metagenome]